MYGVVDQLSVWCHGSHELLVLWNTWNVWITALSSARNGCLVYFGVIFLEKSQNKVTNDPPPPYLKPEMVLKVLYINHNYV